MTNYILIKFYSCAPYLLLVFTLSILTIPASIIAHEIGHIFYAKMFISKNGNIEQFSIKGYLYIYPRFLGGGSTFIKKDKNIVVNLSDMLEDNHEYKELIKLYSSGITFQMLYIIFTTLIFFTLLFLFITKDIFILLLLIVAYTSPLLIWAIITFLFAKGNLDNNTNDRLEIKKYKKILKDIKTINKKTKKLLKKGR